MEHIKQANPSKTTSKVRPSKIRPDLRLKRKPKREHTHPKSIIFLVGLRCLRNFGSVKTTPATVFNPFFFRWKGGVLPGKLTCPLKINGWKKYFLLKWSLFMGHVSFRGCTFSSLSSRAQGYLLGRWSVKKSFDYRTGGDWIKLNGKKWMKSDMRKERKSAR